MTDREKVIKGLECCIKYPNEYGDCLGGDCPYEPRIECHKELMRDSLALLKAQEPRVMTVEEVIESEVGAVVWLEDIDEPTAIAGLVDRVFTGTMVVDFQCVARTVTAGFDDYGKRWRCWTSRPSAAEMEAIPWE